MSDPINPFDNIEVNRDAITKDDILKLFTDALKLGDPFVSEFNRRVVVPIAQKIENRVKVTPINVDGDEFGEYLIETLKGTSEKSTKSAGKTIGKTISSFADSFKISVPKFLESKLGLDIKIPAAEVGGMEVGGDLKEYIKKGFKKQIDISLKASGKGLSDNFKRFVDNFVVEKPTPLPVPTLPNAKQTDKFNTLSEEGPAFTIGDYTEKALDKLGGLFGKIGLNKMGPAAGEEKEQEGFLSSLLKKFPFLMMLLGGLAGLFGLFTSGPLKGLAKILTKFALGGVLKTIGKALLGKGLKRIPIIGTVVSLAFAVDRFRRGDITGGVIDVVSGLAGLLDLAVPGLGTTLSLGVDVLNAYLDFKAGGSSAEASAKKWDILKEMSVAIYKKLEPLLRYMPIIGPAILLKEAYDSYKAGRDADAMVTLGQAFGAILPGIGPVFVALGDWMRSTQVPNMESTAFNIANLFRDLQDKLGEKFVEFFDASPTWLKWVLKRHPVFSKILEKQKEPDLAFAKQYEGLAESEKTSFERDIRKRLVKERQHIAQTLSETDRLHAELERRNAQKRIDKLEHQLAMISDAKKQPQNDFIWRAGQKPQAFSPQDNVIAIKDVKVFEDLAKALKDQKHPGESDQNSIIQIQREVQKLIQSIDRYLTQAQERDRMFQQNVLSIGAQQKTQGSITPVDVDIRDPAYILRAKTWERLREGVAIY